MAVHGEMKRETNEIKIIGESAPWKKVLGTVELVASTDATVLITGESGTGKELIAQAVHEKSPRSEMPLVKVNCAAIAPELFESEFFGHAKGSFTGAATEREGRFQAADGGTVFLDEIGEIPLNLQGKLLRVLQEGEYQRVGEDKTRSIDVRVVAATNKNLAEEAESGEFRLDLFYRLSVFPINLPPLRERLEDVEPLAGHFLEKVTKKLQCPISEFSKEDIQALQNYHYPGNVRELENIIERAAILSSCGFLGMNLSKAVESMMLPGEKDKIAEYFGKEPAKPDVLTYAQLKELERENIIKALKLSDYKVYGKSGAAELLETKPTTLASKIKSMNISMRPE